MQIYKQFLAVQVYRFWQLSEKLPLAFDSSSVFAGYRLTIIFLLVLKCCSTWLLVPIVFNKKTILLLFLGVCLFSSSLLRFSTGLSHVIIICTGRAFILLVLRVS